MKVSLALVSLGLCAAPAFAQSLATVVLHSSKETWPEEPQPGQCISNWEAETPVFEIDVHGHTPGVHCTFYTEQDCTGQSLRLREGDHKFRRDFFVGSLDCAL